MILDVDNAVPRLLEWGLVDDSAVVAGDVRVTSVARRNHNLRVEIGRPRPGRTRPGRGRTTGWLIKQPGPDAASSARTLAVEAAFCELCRDRPDAARVARHMARLRSTFPDGPILVFELLAGAEPLRRRYRDRWQDEPGRLAMAGALGAALGDLHAAFRGSATGLLKLAALPEGPPWSLRIHRPAPSILASLTPAQRELLRIVQGESAIFDALDAAHSAWRGDTVIHGDLRFDNVLASAEDSAAQPGVRLVDWETVRYGDPAWDLAVALQELALLWLSGMSHAAELDAAERVSTARYPLAEIQVTLAALWRGYLSTAELVPAERQDLLLRAVRFSAVCLVQAAWEDSTYRAELTSRAVLALQTSANVLADPERAAADLYGL